MGFNTIAGPQVGAAGGIDGANVGQFSAGYASRVLDLAELNGSQQVRVVMRFTAGVQYAQVTDIVYRKTV